MSAKDKLTPKQNAFVKAYLLNGGNATQAAIDAGYKEDNAAVIGCENLIKPNIKSAIKKHQKKSDDSYVWTKSDKLKKSAKKIIDKHLNNDNTKDGNDSDQGRRRQAVETLLKHAQKIDEFLEENTPKMSSGKRKREVQSNITDSAPK